MNTLLQWAWPHICLSTVRIRPLATILEDTKEDDGKQGSKSGVVSKKRGICQFKSKILPFIRKDFSSPDWFKKVASKLRDP